MAEARLLTLPGELLWHITEHLAPYETVALGLTCRQLHWHGQSFATRAWADLRAQTELRHGSIPDSRVAPDEEGRWQLLQLLKRDLPGYELCHFCRILHVLPDPGSSRSACSWQESSGVSWWNLGKLRFCDVNLVMTEGRPISSLFVSTDWTRHPNSDGPTSSPAGYVKLDTKAYVAQCSDPVFALAPVARHNELVFHTAQRLWIPVKTGQSLGAWGAPEDHPRALPAPYLGFQTCRHSCSYYLPHVRPDTTTGLRDVDTEVRQFLRQAAFLRAPITTKIFQPFLWRALSAENSRSTSWICPLCQTLCSVRMYDHANMASRLLLIVGKIWASVEHHKMKGGPSVGEPGV